MEKNVQGSLGAIETGRTREVRRKESLYVIFMDIRCLKLGGDRRDWWEMGLEASTGATSN